MRGRWLSWLALSGALTAALLVTLARPTIPHSEEVEEDQRSGLDQPDAAAWHDLQRRRPVDGGDMPALYSTAAQQVNSLSRFASRINRVIPAAQAAARVWLSGSKIVASGERIGATALLDTWTPLGPGNIGGRTRVIKFHPTVPTTLFAAGVSGGVWKSDDNGITWRPSGDGLTNIAVNTLAINPRQPDVMFVGTGEGYFREEIRGTGLPLRGAGIFITRNGGGSWQQVPATTTPDFQWVNDIELGVNDPRRLYAATRSGIWRSTDEGATWAQMLTVSVRGGCLDLALRPDRNEDVLFASCGSYDQGTVYRFPNAAANSNVEVVLRDPSMGRTSIAIAPSNPDVIYALAASNVGGPGGNYRQGLLAVFRSTGGGTAGSWQARVTNQDANYINTLLLTNIYSANVNACNPQNVNFFSNMGWYNNVIAVDPRDPDRVWAAGVDWFRSDDGGATWGLADFGLGQTGMHVDQHAITFHPAYDGTSNQVAIAGNDGGLWRTDNARAATATGPRPNCNGQGLEIRWASLNRGYGVTQFYHGTPYGDGTQYVGGAQDNSTLMGSDNAGPDGWRAVYNGDGGFTAVNPLAPQTFYAELQWSSIARTTNGGNTFTPVRSGLDPIMADGLGPEANYLFVTPFVMDPKAFTTLWLGGEYLFRMTDGLTWQRAPQTRMPDGGLVSALAVSPSSAQGVIGGTHKGDLFVIRNAGEPIAGVSMTTTRPRDGWVTSVAYDPRLETVLYATYGNFGGAHVFRSINGGADWESIDGRGANRIPDIPVHSIAVDPDDSQRLYLGTDVGVMVSTDGGQNWMVEETGFGPAVTMWLAPLRVANGPTYLFAFTHGRGAWRVRLR